MMEPDVIEELLEGCFDRDNMPRMSSELAVSVRVAKKAVDEIERLREVNIAQMKYIEAERVIRERLDDEIERLRKALRKIRGGLGDPSQNGLLPHEIADAALVNWE